MIDTEIKYKTPTISWLPEIPGHWKVRRLKSVIISDTNGVWGDEPRKDENDIFCIRVADIDNWNYGISEENLTIRNIEKKEQESRLLKYGDLLIEKSGGGDISPVGRVVMYNLHHKAVTSNFMARLNISPVINNEYLLFYFRFLYNCRINKQSIKATTGIQNIDLYSYLQNPVVIPPKEEQDSIVEYIKMKSEKINHFISAKRRFIELLKEQRQGIIDHAVTKGISSNVNMKFSGIDWLGDIPEHWEVRRLGTIGTFSKGGNVSRADLLENETGLPAILYGDIYTKYDINVINVFNQISEETAERAAMIGEGDLLFTGSGETKEDIGKCIVYSGNDKIYIGGDAIIFKQNLFDSLFLSYSQNSSFSKYQKAISSKGDIIVHTYSSKLKYIVMPFPPIEEQKQINEFIKGETANIATAISKAEYEIELIKEYKESLIAEVVTGKIKLI